MTRPIASCLLLLLSSCTAAPDPQKIVPPPEVTENAEPLPPFSGGTCSAVVQDDLRIARQYQILEIENDAKAGWIKQIFGVKP